MVAFEPESARQQCAATINDSAERSKFVATWKDNAERRANGWGKHREHQSKHPLILRWIAEYTEYLTATANAMEASLASDHSIALDPRWPIIGPEVEPPAYLHQFLREVTPDIEPDTTYLKSCYAVHWVFHNILRRCPKCKSKRIESSGWNQSGPREVHGLFREGMAIGVQIRCNACAGKDGKGGKGGKAGGSSGEGRYCWTTTSAEFWENFEHWELPVGLPHFFSRSAVTAELYDFIIEMRLKSTSAGLAENIKQFHLLEYHRQHYAYLQAYRARSQQTSLVKAKPLVPFSPPVKKKVGKQSGGFDNRSISDDLITAIFLKFSNETRIAESEEHMRTLSAVAISIDTTFRCAYKATLVDKNKARVKSHLGGFVSVINQKSQPISWRLCHSQSQTETEEMLTGLSNRHDILELPPPEIMTADNCCQIRNTAERVFPDIDVVQDVWHFLMRYLACVKDGTKNPYRAQVANDIVGAILKSKASNGVPAVYHTQPEQEKRLVEAFNKWDEHGGVWTAAAAKVHAKQLSHIQKGCLARSRNDIATDGSRIEGSHKGWNSIMRSFASGLEVMNALGHDHVLRHNVRLDMADEDLDRSMFIYHTHGSHHIRLTNACAKAWNSLLETQKKNTRRPSNLRPLPELCPADSNEKFGLVRMSAATATQYSLAMIKQEPGDEALDLSLHDILDADRVLEEIGVDPVLLNTPAAEPPTTTPQDSAHSMDVKGKGVKRAREEDDEVHEITRAEWGVPMGWFPPSSSALSPGSLSTASTLLGSSSAAATAAAAAAAATTSLGSSSTASTSQVAIASMSSDTSTSAIMATTAPTFTMAVVPPLSLSSLSVVPQVPLFDSSLSTQPSSSAVATTGTSAVPALAPATEGLASSMPATSSSPTPAITAPIATPTVKPAPTTGTTTPAPLVSGGQPPKKKACLTVAGMPAMSKSRQDAARDGSSPAHTARKQCSQQRSHPGPLDTMFALAQMSTATATSAGAAPLTPTNEPYLPRPAIVGLTRSQRLFSVVTQVDPRALTFGRNASSEEFYLFMKLRATHKWATFHMSPYDWVCAASTYNTGIKNLNRERGTTLSLKTPRALLDKLSEVEAVIFGRIRDDNYRSHSGRTEFWQHHCKAVYLGKKIQKMIEDATFKMNKNHVCGRCKRIMYPEAKSHQDNHSRNVCSDGIRQSSEKVHLVINGVSRDFVEHPPPFPQPKEVFTGGNVFHPVRFMEVVAGLYDRIVVNQSAPGALAMNDYAFAMLLRDRTVMVPGLDGRPCKVLFKLFHSFKLAPGEAVVLDDHEGETYLRMDCLSEPPLEVLQDAAGDGPGSAESA